MNGLVAEVEDDDDRVSKNPLDILTDVKTRQNSTYIAQKRLLELYNAMHFLLTSLIVKQDHISQKEGKRLERLCLTTNEKI